MNILLLMAGDSGLFAEAGHPFPKNLVEIDGLPLVERVIGQFSELLAAGDKLVCVIREDETAKFHTADVVHLLVPGATVVTVPAIDSGAACTALLAVDHIDTDEPLLIFNGDQILRTSIAAAIEDFRSRDLDGGVVVFPAVHPRWSYVKTDDDGLVVEAAEKRPISKLATAGTYWFARGSDFVRAAMAMITKDANVQGRFYVCPAFNELILTQVRIGIHAIDRADYISLATPQGVHQYEEALSGTRPLPGGVA